MTDSWGGSLADRIARAALASGASVGVAESLTSGLLASRLGAGDDASEWFMGGVVAYSTAVKQFVLGVSAGPVVSARCAEEMAVGAAAALTADLAVSTTGAGGPSSEEGHPPGTVHLGWSYEGRSGSERHLFNGDSAAVLEQTVDAALQLILAMLKPGR